MPAERSPTHTRHVVRLYVVLTVAGAGVLAWSLIVSWGAPIWWQVAFFWSVNALTRFDRVSVPVKRLAIARSAKPQSVMLSPGFVVLMTAAYATTPSTAVFVALVPSIPSLLRREQSAGMKLLFNTAQEAIYVGVGSAVYAALTHFGDDVALKFAAAAAVAALALAINTGLVAGVVALDAGMNLRDVVRRMTWTIPHSVGFGLVGLMIATLFREFGIAGAAFLLMPLAAVRFARRTKIELDEARDQAITEFVRAVEAKDPYTFRHSERVATIAVELHRALGAKPKYLDLRWSGGVLHDIGKVAIPVEILTKPSGLTSEEFEKIRRHPGLGADVVHDIDSLRELVPEIRYHHERMDGRGYPEGLADEAIPYEARVLAVADAFEALTSDRPYRPGLSTSEALAELRRTAGAHHDPIIVEALGTILASGVSFDRLDAPTAETRPAADKHAVGQ